jgi:hypothetical protein
VSLGKMFPTFSASSNFLELLETEDEYVSSLNLSCDIKYFKSSFCCCIIHIKYVSKLVVCISVRYVPLWSVTIISVSFHVSYIFCREPNVLTSMV